MKNFQIFMKNFILILVLSVLVFGNFSSADNRLKWRRAVCSGLTQKSCGNCCSATFICYTVVISIIIVILNNCLIGITCCGPAENCCGNSICCGPAENCCDNTFCCGPGPCCGNNCCKASETCCGNTICCGPTETCCGNTCCPMFQRCSSDNTCQ
jgi:hypothetical protein